MPLDLGANHEYLDAKNAEKAALHFRSCRLVGQRYIHDVWGNADERQKG